MTDCVLLSTIGFILLAAECCWKEEDDMLWTPPGVSSAGVTGRRWDAYSSSQGCSTGLQWTKQI